MSANTTLPFSGEEIPLWASVLLVCLYAVSTVIGLCGSGLIVFTLVSDHRFRQASYTVYLTNLVVTDLFVQLYYFPLLAVGLLLGRHPVVDNVHCVVNGFLFFVCSIVFMFTLAAISLDRYMCVCHQLVYMHYLSKKTSRIVVVVLWLKAGLVCLPSALDGTVGFDSKIHMCFLQHRGIFTLGHAITVAVVTVTTVAVGVPNALIYWTYYVHRRRVGQSLASKTETQKSSTQSPVPATSLNSAQINNSNPENCPRAPPQGEAGAKTLMVAASPTSPNANHNHDGSATESSGLNVIQSAVQEFRQPLARDSDHTVVRSINETDDDDDDIDSDQSLTLPDDRIPTLTVVEGYTQPLGVAEDPNPAITVAGYGSQSGQGVRDLAKSKMVTQGSDRDVSGHSCQDTIQTSSQAKNAEDSSKAAHLISSQAVPRGCNGEADRCSCQRMGRESVQINDDGFLLTTTANKSVSRDNNQMPVDECDQKNSTLGVTVASGQTNSESSAQRRKPSGGVSKSDIALMRSLLSIFLVFFVLTVPATVAFVVRNVVYISPFVYSLLIWLYAVNTSVNWVIYGIMNSRFRLGYKRAFRKLKSCIKRT